MARFQINLVSVINLAMICVVHSTHNPGGRNVTDLMALLDFKNHITEDPLGIMASWNDSSHHCNWTGITCHPSNERVGILNLISRELVGSLPRSIGNLSFLTAIELRNNTFQGQIPQEIGRLSRLRHLNLTKNMLSGSIPSNLSHCTHLTILTLASNQLSGQIPSQLTSLSKLEFLNLGINNLTGTLPPWFGNFSSQFFFLWLEANNFHGSIPPEIGRLSGLRYFQIMENQFSGSILLQISKFLGPPLPEDIGKLARLNGLYLSRNALTGMIPFSLGNLTSLIRLHLDSNSLRGNIPRHLGNCSDLLQLNVSSNNLTGSIPKEVMSLSSLSIFLGLARNSFSGPLPVEVSKLIHLKALDVSGNELSGAIPSSLSSCLSLEMLVMGGNRFEGVIPESLEALRGLEEIVFSHNNLSGKIPDFLGKLPFLRKLDLSYKDLGGEVSDHGIFSNVSAVFVVGNKQLCGGAPSLNLPSCPIAKGKSNKNLKLRWLITLIIVATCLIVLKCVLSLCCILRKPKKQDKTASSLKDSHLVISYRELHRATNGFSAENLIGSGSFGSVYKGIIAENGSPVAVKVLNLEQRGAIKSFMDECAILRSIRHRNLLKIIIVRSSIDPQGRDSKCIVTELMANGSLDVWLHPSRDATNALPTRNLKLMERLNIAIDVASALDYLHNHTHTPIIHCDLKPSNILLDEDLMAHVGDFGLAKFLLQNHSISIKLRGSIGYIPPEYGTSTQISTLGDVYSYGILLLELFTGKRPTDDMFNNDLSIHKYIAMALPEHAMEVSDPSLVQAEIVEGIEILETHRANFEQLNSREVECLISILKIGVSCSMPSPEDRTQISSILNQLHTIKGRN